MKAGIPSGPDWNEGLGIERNLRQISKEYNLMKKKLHMEIKE